MPVLRSAMGAGVRTMTGNDLNRIIEIDTKVLGRSRQEYWEMKFELPEKRSPIASLVAEVDGKAAREAGVAFFHITIAQ